MASAKENVPRAPPQPLPRQTRSSPRLPPPPPLRPKTANGATEPPPVSGVLKCMCFRLPSRTSKKPALPSPPAPKLSNASGRRNAVAPDVSASQSQRVTSRASASLSSRWPSGPSASASGGDAGGGSVVASSSSFSHWRCRSLSSSRVMPHGERASSFSFAVSPAAASSTPKIAQGWRRK